MKIEIIDERTVATSLLPKSKGWVLDVGARGYAFAQAMAKRKLNVVAVDPIEPAEIPHKNIHAVAVGVVGAGLGGKRMFADWDNSEGSCLIDFCGPVPERAKLREVDAVDVLQIMETFKVDHWACVKMNCEGAEYSILETWPGPIATQITVSFHDHTGANPGGEATYERILKHLGQWYEIVRHVKEARYCAGLNYWDSFFILKEALKED